MKKAGWWTLFVVLVLATAFFALTLALGVASIVSGNLQQGDSRGSAVGGAVIILIITAVLAWLAWLVEHHVRTHHGPAPAAPTVWAQPSASPDLLAARTGWAQPSPSPSPDRPAPSEPPRPLHGGGYEGPVRVPQSPPEDSPPAEHRVGRPSRRVRRNTPHSYLGALVGMGVLALLMVVVAVSGFVDWRQSEAVQHHGIAATGVVARIHYVQHSTRSGSYTTFNLDVLLGPPVLGRQLTTVHSPDRNPPANVGDQITILVDRGHPGYAELPGQPAHTIWQGVIGSLLLVFFASAAVAAAVAFRRSRVRTRQPS